MSRFGNALALMGAGMGGYANGRNQYRQQQQEDEDRAYQRTQRERTQAEQQRADELRQNVSTAMATPDSPRSARMEIVADAYDKAGQPDAAERYRALARQAREEGVLELTDAIRSSAPGLDAVRGTKAGFVSHEIPPEALKAYDGTGKWRIRPGTVVQSYVGKNAYGEDEIDHRLVTPDGKVVLDSLNLASRFIGMNAGQRAEAGDRAAATRYTVNRDTKESQFRRDDADRNFRLREQEVADKGLVRAAQAEAAAARAAASRAGAAQPTGPTMADLKDGFKQIASTLNADYKMQIEGALTPEAATPLKQRRESEIADVQRLYQGAVQHGMALSPEQAIAAYRQGKRGVATVRLTDGSTAQVTGVRIGDRFIPMASEVGQSIPAPAAAPSQQPGRAAPAAAPARSARMGSEAPAPAPERARHGAALETVMADKAQRVAVAQEQVNQANQLLAAAAKSGDPQSIAHYTNIVIKATQALDAAKQ